MYELEQEFDDVIEFVHLNVDDGATLPMRQHFGFTDRSQYALVTRSGEIWRRWAGPIHYENVASGIRDFLAEEAAAP